MRFCDVKKFIFAALLIGIGIGIWLSRCFGFGWFIGLVFIVLGVWRLF